MPTRPLAVALAFALAPSIVQAKPSHETKGLASYYSKGQKTASGEWFRPDDMSAAHRTLPIGTLVRVINRKNGRSVSVRVNDRGPFVRRRVIDVSRGAARKLHMIKRGVVPVRLEIGETVSTVRTLLRKIDSLTLARKEAVRNSVEHRPRLGTPEIPASVGADATARMREIVSEMIRHDDAAAVAMVEAYPPQARSLFADSPIGIIGNIFRSFLESLIKPAGSHVRMECEDGQPFPEPLRRVLARAGQDFNATVYVVSGYRPLAYNRRVYGNRRSKNGRYVGDGSQHVRCKAADIRVAGIGADRLHTWARRQPEIGGLGRYRSNFVHLDIRPKVNGKLVMWDWRKKKRTRYAYRRQHRG